MALLVAEVFGATARITQRTGTLWPGLTSARSNINVRMPLP
jgi:hypothetical protein